MASLATADDMIARYDSRILGDLCSSNKVQIPEDELSTNSVMTTALSTATGRIKSTVLRAKRYTIEELEALTGDAQDFLKDLVCRAAILSLYRRKGYANDKVRDEIQKIHEADMESLRKGDDVFDISRAQVAGIPEVKAYSRLEINNKWGLFVDQARPRFYPRRRSYNNE